MVSSTTCLSCSGGDGAVQKKVRWVSTAAPAMQWAVQARAPGVPTAHPGASAGPLPQQHPVSSAHSLHRWEVLHTSAMAQQLMVSYGGVIGG